MRNLLRCGLKPGRQESLPERQRRIRFRNLLSMQRDRAAAMQKCFNMTYFRLANKMAGINKRDEATVMQLNNLSLMENIILHEVDLGIMRGKHYQEIYKDCKERLETVKDLAYLEAV